MARVVTGARVEPGGLGGSSNFRKGGENIATGGSGANARVNAAGAAGVGRAISPACYCPGSPHGDSLTSVNATQLPTTPTKLTRPTSKDKAACLTSVVREQAVGVNLGAVAAPTANQLSRSEQLIVKRAPVAQASNSERTVRFNPVVEILECPRRRCGTSSRGSPGGGPPSPPPVLPPSPPLSRRSSRPRSGALRAPTSQHLRSPTPPPAHRKAVRNTFMSGGSGTLTAGSSTLSTGSRGLGEGGALNLLRNRRSLRLPSPHVCSPSGSASNMGGVAHPPGPVRLAWRALAGRSSPRPAANLRPLRRRSGPGGGPILATKSVRGRGQRSALGMALSSASSPTPNPAQSNSSASANALPTHAATTQPPAPAPAPTSQSSPALQPSSLVQQQQGNVPLPPTSPQATHQSCPNTTTVDSKANIPLPPALPPSPKQSLSEPPPKEGVKPSDDTTETRVASAGIKATLRPASSVCPTPSTTSTRSDLEPPSGSFFGPKPAGPPVVRPSPPKTSMSLATAQSTMAGVALARARAAATVARAGIIDSTPPAPPPSRGSDYGAKAASKTMVGTPNKVAAINNMLRLHSDEAASESSKTSDTTASAPALAMALMHPVPLPLPPFTTSSTRDARTTTPSLGLTNAIASASAVSHRSSSIAEETPATTIQRMQSPSPGRIVMKASKQRCHTPPPGSSHRHSSRQTLRGQSASPALTAVKTTAEEQGTVSPSPTRPGSNTHSKSCSSSQVHPGKDTSSSSANCPGSTSNKLGGDESPSTSGGLSSFSILNGVPSVTGGCVAELISRSRTATLVEQAEEALRLGGRPARLESRERLSSKAPQPHSPSHRKHSSKASRTTEAKKSAARDKLSPTLDERGDRTEKGEKEEKRDSLKDTADNTEREAKCASGSSLNSMLKIAAPKGMRKKSQKRNHSEDKERGGEVLPVKSVPTVVPNDSTPNPPPAAAAASSSVATPPTKSVRGASAGVVTVGAVTNAPSTLASSSSKDIGGGGGGGCLVGTIAVGGVPNGGVAGIVTGGGSGGAAGVVTSVVRVASASKTNRICVGGNGGGGGGGGLEKILGSPDVSVTSQLTLPPSTPGDVASTSATDVKAAKRGKRKASDVVPESPEQTKMGKIKVKEKKKTNAVKSGKRKEEGSRSLLKGSKDGPPHRSLSLTELGRTLRSGCWTLVEACIRGTKAAANGNSPQLTVVFRAKGTGPPPGAPLFRPPPTPPAAGSSSQRQWANRPTRLTSASTSSRLSVVGEKSPVTNRGGRAASVRGSSAGSCRDVRMRNIRVSAGGSFVAVGSGVGPGVGSKGAARTSRRRTTQKRRPNTSATRRRVSSGMARLRGSRLGRRSSGGGGGGGGGGGSSLECRGSTGSAHRMRARVLHRATTLAPPARRTNRPGARRYPSTVRQL